MRNQRSSKPTEYDPETEVEIRELQVDHGELHEAIVLRSIP